MFSALWFLYILYTPLWTIIINIPYDDIIDVSLFLTSNKTEGPPYRGCITGIHWCIVSQPTAFGGRVGGYTSHQLVGEFVGMYQEVCGASMFCDGEQKHKKKNNKNVVHFAS